MQPFSNLTTATAFVSYSYTLFYPVAVGGNLGDLGADKPANCIHSMAPGAKPYRTCYIPLNVPDILAVLCANVVCQ